MRLPYRRLFVFLFGVLLLSISEACRHQGADAYLRKAEDFLAHSQIDEAVLELRLAEQADPKRGDVREKLADTYARLPDLPDAYREYVRAADLLPTDLHAQIMAGKALLATRQFEDAKTRAKQALGIDSKSVDAEILLGNALAGLKDLDGAIAEFEDAIVLDPSQDAPYANIGTIQLVRGQKTEAEASFRKAIEVAPKSVAVRLAFANFLWASHRTAETEQALKDVIALEPNNLTANATLGAFYMASNRAAEAEPYFQTVANTAKTPAATLALARYYTVTKRLPDARRVLEAMAAKNDDTYATAVTHLAALDAQEGQRAQAERRLDDLLFKKPKELSARVLLARLYALDGRGDDAVKEATGIVTDAPNSPEAASAYLVIGAVQANRDRPEDAVAAYLEAVKRQSQPISADAALASLMLKSGDYYQAETYVKQALEIQPDEPRLLALQVRAWIGQGKSAEAAGEIETLRTRYPNSPTVLDLLAAQQLKARNGDAARAAYAKAAALAPNDLEALDGLVGLDLASGRTKEALARVEDALKWSPPSVEVLIVAGRAYARAGNLTKAEEVLRRAIELEPARLEAYGLLGGLYTAEHRLNEAEDELRVVTTKNPKAVAAGTMLGMILEAEKKAPEAEAQYQKVLASDGEAAVAANNLAWIYVASNRNLAQALLLARTAARHLPNNPHVNDTLGWVYYHQNMTAEAVRYLEASVKSDAGDPSTQYHLGMAYLTAGDAIKAKHCLTQALAINASFEDAGDARRVLGQLNR